MRRVLLLQLACLLAVSSFVYGQNGHMGHPIDKNIVFPHFAIGAGVNTQIILMNPRPGNEVTGTLFFFTQSGAPLSVVNNGQSVNQLQVTLPPEGIEFISVSGATGQATTVGWALLDVTGPGQGQDDPRTRVFGSVTFTTTQGSNTVGSVGVVAGRYELGAHRTVAVPVIVQGNTINTGVALVNSGAAAMTISFQLKDRQGTVVQEAATINPPISPLAPGNQTARFVTELFSGFNFNNNDFRGTLVISAQQEGLVVTGLLSTNALLTSIPVVLVPGQGPGGGNPQTHTVNDVGFTFNPATVTITAGDSVQWQIASIHNVVEVTEATWNANGNTPKAGGFSTTFGGGTVQFNTPGTYWYVCSPHASAGMKGRVIVNPAQ
ncbi:MAG: hypothetical protein EHM61_20725 [Acidobacteria bacterium]|nr:MAG: hypothetical protein EHM61_20725 [Acidobacteriota bacterium]